MSAVGSCDHRRQRGRQESDFTLVAVGTPSTTAGIDLRAVISATRTIGWALAGKKEYHVVVVKSTVVPGTTDGIVLPLLEEGSGRPPGDELGIGVNPEFLTEGQAVTDFMSARPARARRQRRTNPRRSASSIEPSNRPCHDC